jgi:CxxC-x17-CxxC domain-containing protein
MHSAVCDKCGKDCEVPFRPTQGKPLYCSDCFKDKSKEAGSRSELGKPRNNENLDQINKKLDKILKILEEHVKEKPKKKSLKKKVKTSKK